MEGKKGNHLAAPRLWELLPPGALQCATSFGGKNPFSAKATSTDSLTTDDLQPDISLWILNGFVSFPLSLALPFFSPRNRHGTQTLFGEKEERERDGR